MSVFVKSRALLSGCGFAVGFSVVVVAKFFFGTKYRLCKVEGPSMRPTLNPQGSWFSDVVLVRPQSSENVLQPNQIVCAKRKERFLIKRLKAVDQNQCWLESDAGPGYWDSSIFGSIPCDSANEVLGIIFPPHRIRSLV